MENPWNIEYCNQKFEDFQKSEMIQSSSVDLGIEYSVTAIYRKGVMIVLKLEERKL